MAEGLLREMLTQAGEEFQGIKVESAGISAISNQWASKQAVIAMDKEGIDISNHRSRPLTKEMIKRADIILTMTVVHKNAILQMSPKAKYKVFTLKEYVQDEINTDEILDQLGCLYDELNKKRDKMIKAQIGEVDILNENQRALIREWEKDIVKIRRLEEQMPSLDIIDPFGQPVEEYIECAMEIKAALVKVLEKIR